MKKKLLITAAASVVVLAVVLAVNLLALEQSGIAETLAGAFKSLVGDILPSRRAVPEQLTQETEVYPPGSQTQETLAPDMLERQSENEGRLVDGCLGGKDCIPSINAPRFISAGQARYLNEDDKVIGLVHKGEARAYPLKIMDYHNVVNDTIGGYPVAVTYCPLSGVAAAFEAEIESRKTLLQVSGKLLNNNLVLYDDAGGLWSQMTGEALTGPQTGKRLVDLPVQVMTYAQWLEKNPKTRVLSDKTGLERDYSLYPYGDYLESPVIYYPLEYVGSRLPAKAVVYGVLAGGKAKAYPLSELLKVLPEGGEFIDEIGDAGITIGYQDGFFSVSGLSESTAVSGGEQEGIRREEPTGERAGVIAETQASTQSAEIAPVFSRSAFWFAWAAFYPKTDVYLAK